MTAGCSAAAVQYTQTAHVCTAGGSLPFTGLNLAWLLITALALIAVGLLIWSKAWRN